MADVKLKKDCPFCGGKGKFHCGSSYFFEARGGEDAVKVKMYSASISCRGCGMLFPRGPWFMEVGYVEEPGGRRGSSKKGGYPAAKKEVARRWDKRV